MSLFKHAFLAMDEANIVLEVVDARFADLMHNPDLERKLLRKGKIVILVFNKMDLVENKEWKKHIHQDGARFHVLWWDFDGTHCSEENCEINKPT
jgi:ribosome biogenesis GTPase A